MNAVHLAGKIIVISGASRGIGAATALECAAQGADLALMARSTTDQPHRVLPGTLDDVAAKARDLGANVLTVAADVSDDADVARVRDAVLARFGRCDVLVNNAAASFVGPFLELAVKRWDVLMGVNVRGPMLMAKAFLPAMVQAGGGAIVNVTSTGGAGAEHPDLPGMLLAYNVSKAALNRFTTGLATEMRSAAIAVNALEVQAVTPATLANLPDTDLSALELPEAPAQVIAWIARQSATVTGNIFNQDELLARLREQGVVRAKGLPRS
jgi:citronellol/citronellal dehydrogenase